MTTVNTDTITSTELFEKAVAFINETGIPCKSAILEHPTFLPGLDIQNGCIFYDKERMLYPGDILHEAGHLAVLSPSFRKEACSPDKLSDNLEAGAAEMAAIAWSWAAICHLQIPAEFVFHPHGYKGASASILENFSQGRYFGVSMLQWLGMTKEAKHTTHTDDPAFPNMTHWLRQQE